MPTPKIGDVWSDGGELEAEIESIDYRGRLARVMFIVKCRGQIDECGSCPPNDFSRRFPNLAYRPWTKPDGDTDPLMPLGPRDPVTRTPEFLSELCRRLYNLENPDNIQFTILQENTRFYD